MRKVKSIFILLISIFIITGCNTSTFEYNGDEIFYEVNGTETDTINADGGKIIVKKNQAFLEINDDTKDYDAYLSGEHKVSKKDKFYRYYFVSLEEVKNNKFDTAQPIKFNDEKFGELYLNVDGVFDYKISNIKQFASSYVKVDPKEFIDIKDFVKSIVLETVVEEIVKLDVKYTDLSSYAETIKLSVVNALREKGIECQVFNIQNISLIEDSKEIVAAFEYNETMLKTYIQNTTWIASDNSEIIFDKERFNWYLNQNDHSDNIQYGDYVFYTGDLAVEYILNDLKSFGVSRMALEDLFNNNENYSKNNFVVFNIKLEGYTINGTSTIVNNDIYWYGFLLSNNQNLQVVNMTTKTYYNFMKKS